MGWGDILHNALKDAEGVVDPRNYVKAGKTLVEHPLRFGEQVGNSYLQLAEHPLRTFQNHPLDTLLQLAPVTKLGALAGEEGATAASFATGSTRAEALASQLGKLNEATSPIRAGKAIAETGKNEATLWKALKYDKGTGVPRNPFGGTVPGAKFDEGMLGKLHAQLGFPNVTHDVKPGGGENIAGYYQYKNQNATTFLHPGHLTPGEKVPAAEHLTQSMLHEARHGYQHANWPQAARFVDKHIPYKVRPSEIDANRFMKKNSPQYEGLVSPDIVGHNLHQAMNSAAAPLPSTVPELSQLVGEVNKGVASVSPEELVQHLQQLVHGGHLNPDDAMDLEDGLLRKSGYQPPQSKQELLHRALAMARG